MNHAGHLYHAEVGYIPYYQDEVGGGEACQRTCEWQNGRLKDDDASHSVSLACCTR